MSDNASGGLPPGQEPGPYGQQPGPYGQQPGAYGPYNQQPGPYGQQPGPAGPPPQGPYGGAPAPGPYGPQGGGYPPPGPEGGGYAFGPFSPAPGQAPPGPGGYPGAPAPVPPAAAAPRRRGRLFVILGVVALVLVLGIVGVVALIGGAKKDTADPPVTSSTAPAASPSAGPSTAPPPAAKPSDAVAGFLQALAAGNAKAAAGYAATPVSSRALIDDKVLRASMKRAPLTAITVSPVDGQTTASVPATYKLGSSTVNARFSAVKVGDAWKLRQVTSPLDLGLMRTKSVPMLVNGKKVSGNSVAALPGSYVFSTGLRNLSYSGKAVTVKAPGIPVSATGVRLTMTSTGKKAAIRAARSSFNTCLEQKSLKPKNCPFKLTSTYSYTKSTIRWSRTGSDPFKKPKVTSLGGKAVVTIKFHVKITGRCHDKQGNSGTCSGSGKITGFATVPLATKPKVTWL